jgi:NAD(P) transhydrogenase subunit alpha
MQIFVPCERRPGELRVAIVPDVVTKYVRAGFTVAIESGAGIHAQADDGLFKAAGAEIVTASEISKADVILSVNPLTPEQFAKVKKGAITISFLSPNQSLDSIAAATKSGATAFSLELVPRISRAQSMDALTSQALCAGYRAALVAADLSPRFFPLLMTAAGTVTPANVVVLGAGVAGLQAIATARRLGAVVSAYDVRPASADEVRSMGATFIDLKLEALEGAGGYAREMSEERAAKQRELLTPYLANADVVITTAAVPGRPAPRLVTEEMVAAMKVGSVIVDLAAESGGNVAGSKPGEIVEKNGVRIWGGKDVPSQLSFHASQLFAKNCMNLLMLMVKSENDATGANKSSLYLDFADEIIAASALTHQGEVRHEGAKTALASGANGKGNL